MKTIAKLVSIIMVLMIALDLPASGLAEERDLNADFETALSGIAYTSVAQVQSNLYFLGTDLYACEVAGGPVVKIDAYFPEELLEAAMSGDLILVQGGEKGHVLDTLHGTLYSFEEKETAAVAQFTSDVFDGETDPLEKHHYLMPVLVQTDKGDVLYILVSKKDSPTEYELYHFNLVDLSSGLIKTENVLCIADYKEDKIVAILEQPDLYSIIEIDTSSNQVCNTLFKEENPRYRINGMAYDPKTDRLVVATSKGIFKIANKTMVDLCTYLPQANGRVIRDDFYCFLDNQFVFINSNLFYFCELMDENAPHRLRFANSGLDQTIRGFMEQYPDVQVSFLPEVIWDTKHVFESLLSQDSNIDIITLYAGASLTTVKEKGYYVDVSASEILMQNVSAMYPEIQHALMDREKLAAYPREAFPYCWLIDEAALLEKGYNPDTVTMEDWFTFIESEAVQFDPYESTHTVFPKGFTKKQLILEILKQYIAEYESNGQLNFQDPELREYLERAMDLPDDIFLKSDDDGTSLGAYDQGNPPLFVINTMLSPDAYIGFYEGYHPRYVLPPMFSITPTARMTLSVYLVNPYSQNQETARKFLEYCAQQTTPLQRFYLDQSYQEPIPDQESLELEERMLIELEELKARAAEAKPENQAQIEDAIAQRKIMLEYAQENKWIISEEDIVAYKQIAPRISLLSNSLCFTDSSCGISPINLYEMINMLLSGTTNLDRFLSSLEQQYRMMQMEAR